MNKLLILLALLSFNVLATPVNINKANAKEIAAALKGIGPAKADAIVKYRAKNGSFKSIDDLRNVKGIGEKLISSISSDVGLSGSSKSKKSAPAKTTKSKEKATTKATDKKAKVTEKATKKADKKKDKKVEKKSSKKADKKATKKTAKPKKEKKSSKKSKDKKSTKK